MRIPPHAINFLPNTQECFRNFTVDLRLRIFRILATGIPALNQLEKSKRCKRTR